MNKPSPELWKTYQPHREKAIQAVCDAADNFVQSSCLWRDDMSAKEIRRELFDLLGLQFGFKVIWPVPESAAISSREGEGK